MAKSVGLMAGMLVVGVGCIAQGTAPGLDGRRIVSAEELLGPLQKADRSYGAPVFIPGTHKVLLARTVSSGPAAMEILDADTGEAHQIGEGDKPVLSPDGKKVAFLVGNAGKELYWEATQIWVSDADGNSRRQLTKAPHGLGTVVSVDYAWSPDSKSLAYRFVPGRRQDDPKVMSKQTDGLDAPTVQVFSPKTVQANLNRDTEFHLVSVDREEDRLILKEQFRECDSLSWNAATDSLIVDIAEIVPGTNVYTLRGSLVSISLRDGARTTLLTDLGRQTFHKPKPSPDGTKIAFLADRWNLRYPEEHTLAVFDYKTGKTEFLSKDDLGENTPQWDESGENISFVRGTGLTQRIYRVNLKSRKVEPAPLVNTTGRNSDWTESNDGRLMAWVNTEGSTWITKLYVSDTNGQHQRVLETLADPTSAYATGKVEQINWKSRDGLEIEGFLVLPLDWSPSKKYPLLVHLHGGPTGGVSPLGPLLFHSPLEWDYWAARGYVVFNPDYRASGTCGPTCGWNQIVERRAANDMFERDFDDIMSGVDAVIARGYVDPSRMAIVGHSWGSYETNWVIAHTDRFRTAISFEGGDLLTDWGLPSRAANDSTEWYLQGSPFSNRAAYEKESVISYAADINTPTMFVNGELGVNSPSLSWLYAALRRRGIETEFVYYAADGHVLSRIANQRDLLQRATEWIDKHLEGSR